MSVCQICKWFEYIEGDAEFGYCKKNAPLADKKGRGKWPIVSKNETRCGAFEFNRKLLYPNSNNNPAIADIKISSSNEDEGMTEES